MPLTPCQPCTCISGNIPNDKFKQDIEVILCALVTAVQSVAVDIGPQVANAFTVQGVFVHTQPTMPGSTSVVIAPANPNRRMIAIQNNSNQDIMINFQGATLTGANPTATNKGLVIYEGEIYVSPANAVPIGAITGYHPTGNTTNEVSIVELTSP